MVSGDDKQTLEEWYQAAATTPGDLFEHLPTLRRLAAQCDHVTEFGTRYGASSAALLAAQPRRLVCYDLHRTNAAEHLTRLAGRSAFEFIEGDTLQVAIESTDLLFIDTVHTGDHVYRELTRHAGRVRRWIAIHDTETYGETGDGGGRGMRAGIAQFLAESTAWELYSHARNNHGLTILERRPTP